MPFMSGWLIFNKECDAVLAQAHTASEHLRIISQLRGKQGVTPTAKPFKAQTKGPSPHCIYR